MIAVCLQAFCPNAESCQRIPQEPGAIAKVYMVPDYRLGPAGFVCMEYKPKEGSKPRIKIKKNRTKNDVVP